MERRIIELDIGGKLFRTTKATLCSTDGYFSRMLQDDSWSEGVNDKRIFIDRGKHRKIYQNH